MTERLRNINLNWLKAFERAEAILGEELGDSNEVASLASNPEQLYKNAEIAAAIAMAKASLLGNGERGTLILHDLLDGIEYDTVPYRYAKAMLGLGRGNTDQAEDFLSQEWYSISSLGDDQEEECMTAVGTALLLVEVRRDGYGAIAQRGSTKTTWNLLNALIDDIYDLKDPSARMSSIVELGRVLTEEYDVIWPENADSREVDAMTGHSEMLMHKAIITFPMAERIGNYELDLKQLKVDDPERYTAALVAIINRIANEPHLVDDITPALIDQAVLGVNTGRNPAVKAYYYAQIAAACSAINAKSSDTKVEHYPWDGSPDGFNDSWLAQKAHNLRDLEKTLLWKTYFEKYIFTDKDTADSFIAKASAIIQSEFPQYDSADPDAQSRLNDVMVSIVGALARCNPQRANAFVVEQRLSGDTKKLALIAILDSMATPSTPKLSEKEVIKIINVIKPESDAAWAMDYYFILGKLCTEMNSQKVLDSVINDYTNGAGGKIDASGLSYFLEGAVGGFKGILKRRFS